jgi:surfactin synthase thioesterase subunit
MVADARFTIAAAAQVRAVQLPGRGSRVKETPVSDLMELAEAVATAMLPLLGAIAHLHQSSNPPIPHSTHACGTHCA